LLGGGSSWRICVGQAAFDLRTYLVEETLAIPDFANHPGGNVLPEQRHSDAIQFVMNSDNLIFFFSLPMTDDAVRNRSAWLWDLPTPKRQNLRQHAPLSSK
jgi:hypothetical protein